ncbi:MAG TPA: hypothetical protein PLO78_09720 [Candidatus Omnitrophota bacterium]|nr:hypothetical protein [Candidatus Omnitrophota bacterium]
MDKRIGMVGVAVFCILAVVVCYGFLSGKSDQVTLGEKQGGLGIMFPDMMNQLSQNMSLWPRMNQDEKKLAVSAVIGLYKTRENSAILNTPEFYVGKIDDTLKSDPSVSNLSIMAMLRILAIMEYDYYNGQDKDTLARQILGEKGFTENQRRRQLEQQQAK